MAKKKRTRVSKVAGAKRPAKPAGPAKAAARKPASARKAAEEFVRGVLARGEAARPSKKGRLPPGATHEIVDEPAEGLPRLRRRRFSLA